jgi:hypothetical protein
MAAANHKLTKILAGRTISGTGDSGGKKIVSFSDGSQLTIKVAPSGSNSSSTGGTIDKVRQNVDPPQLYLDLVGGGTFSLDLNEATSSVMLRDKEGNLEYAD